MATTVTLAPTPVGGGTIVTSLYESIWMGGSTFLVIYAQSTPTFLCAAVITLSGDPYTAGTTQTVVSNVMLGSVLPKDPPRLHRLDANRVLMFWSSTTTTDANAFNQNPVFDASIIEITNGFPSIKATFPSVAPGAFLNYTGNASGYGPQQTTTKAQQFSATTTGRQGMIYGQSSSSSVILSVDGATTNRMLIAVRNNTTTSSTVATQKTVSLWDVQYVPATTQLTVTKRIASASSTLFGACQQDSRPTGNYDGPNDFPWIYVIPGTTKVVFGFISYDPNNGSVSGSNNPDANIGAYSTASAFPTGNSASIVDYTQGGATWTINQTISNMRRASLLCPLDGNRLLELCSFQCKVGSAFTGNYARIFTIKDNGFSLDIPLDASTATNNVANGTIAVGLVNQVTPLGNDRVLVSVTTQSATAGVAYMAIYKLLSGTSLKMQVTGNGAVPLTPLTFQRGGDALVQRSANDPSGSSPYDFYGRTSPLSYSFVRYANPS